MNLSKALMRPLIAGGLLCVAMAPAGATTLVRSSLEKLTEDNSTVVVAEVLDAYSYWNDDGSLIFTDVILDTVETVKGEVPAGGLVVTLPGGTVDDLTVLTVAGAELVPGRSYLLFLDDGEFPGRGPIVTVRDHCQGVFDIIPGRDQALTAISQANGHPLVPDSKGRSEAAGGVDGLPVEELVNTIRTLDRRADASGR